METDDIRNERDRQEYEVAFLVRDEGDAERVRDLIVRHGGEIISAGPVRRMALAYKIEKEANAFFGFFRVSFSPGAVPAFTGDLQTTGMTLRYLVIMPPKTRGERQHPREAAEAPKKPRAESPSTLPLSNEALEKKIEEILQ